MNFNFGEWIVEALKIIESSRHLRVMAYGLVLAVVMYAAAALIKVI